MGSYRSLVVDIVFRVYYKTYAILSNKYKMHMKNYLGNNKNYNILSYVMIYNLNYSHKKIEKNY